MQPWFPSENLPVFTGVGNLRIVLRFQAAAKMEFFVGIRLSGTLTFNPAPWRGGVNPTSTAFGIRNAAAH